MCPFRVLEGFSKGRATLLECMAGTTGLEPAASAVTAPLPGTSREPLEAAGPPEDARNRPESVRPRGDLNLCYGCERTTTIRKYNDLQEAGGHLSPC